MAFFFERVVKNAMDLTEIWGVNEKIGIPEIIARAAVMFLLMIVMIRIGGMRSFGKGDVFDNILVILLGSVLARGIVGATPFLSAVAGGVVITGVHSLLSNVSFYSHRVGKVLKGEHLLLYSNGQFIKENMNKTNISVHDIDEQLRLTLNTSTLENVTEIYFERTGEISFVKKSSPSPEGEI